MTLLNKVQIYQVHTQAAAALVQAHCLRLAQVGKRVLEVFCTLRHLVRAIVVAACEAIVDIFKGIINIAAIWSELPDVALGEGREAIVGMFFHRLAYAGEGI